MKERNWGKVGTPEHRIAASEGEGIVGHKGQGEKKEGNSPCIGKEAKEEATKKHGGGKGLPGKRRDIIKGRKERLGRVYKETSR